MDNDIVERTNDLMTFRLGKLLSADETVGPIEDTKIILLR
jgi:hypothetical protein